MVLKPAELKQREEEFTKSGISRLERELKEDIDRRVIGLMDNMAYAMMDKLEGHGFRFHYYLNRFYYSRFIDYFGNHRQQPIEATSTEFEGILQRTIEKYRQEGWEVELTKEVEREHRALLFGLPAKNSTAQGGK